MGRFIRRRIITSVVAIAGVVVITFMLPRLAAGDPALILMSDDALPETIEKTREFWGLNDPIHVQFFTYVLRLFQGNMGDSLVSGRPTVDMIKDFLPNTARLGLVTWVWSISVAIPLGIIAALQRNKPPDLVVRFLALLGRGMPNFWLGIMLILLFAVTFKFLPAFGPGEGFTGRIEHMILPSFVMGSAFLALLVRMVRSEMLEVLNQDYVRTARAKGLAERVVVNRHALRNALIPVVTIVGLEIGGLISGAIITETVFAYPGLGRLTVVSVQSLDYPMVQTLVLFFALIYILMNLIVDIFYAYLDPRIRFS